MKIEDVIHLGITNQLRFNALADWKYPYKQVIQPAELTTIVSAEKLNKIIYSTRPIVEVGAVNKNALAEMLPGDKVLITYFNGIDLLVVMRDHAAEYEASHND